MSFQPPKTLYAYKCESGCGHVTMIDKFYKTKRVFCGVCGTKETMEYKGEYTLSGYQTTKVQWI
jgi:hypothetical protein